MVKIILFLSFIHSILWASPLLKSQKKQLITNCLSCHQKQKIPSELIYRRYLMKYSNKSSMQKVIKIYLQKPKKENSIMPPQFFLKFPMRKRVDLGEKDLENNIKLFLEYFDIRHKLVLD